MHLYCGVSKARGREYGGITDNGDTLACLCHKQRVSNETMHIKMDLIEILIKKIIQPLNTLIK